MLTFYIRVLAVFSFGLGCDKTFYLQSHNKICDDTDCNSYTTGLVQIPVSGIICFNHVDGNITRISFRKAEAILKYKPIYKTCDYNLVTRTHTRCYNAGTCSYSSCTSRNLDDGGDFKSTNTSLLAHRRGCFFSGSACTDYCGYNERSRCIWIDWEIKIGGESSCRNILQIEHITWQLYVTHQTSSGTRTLILSPESPIINNPVPMSIVSFLSPRLTTLETPTTAIQLDSSQALRVSASSLNQPVADTLGDLQIPLMGNSTPIYPKHNVHCDYGSCFPTCYIPPSALRRLVYDIDLHAHHPATDFFTLTSIDSQLIGRQPIAGVLTLLFETSVIDHLKVEHARCSFESLFVIGCSGCKSPSLVGWQAVSIKSYGLVPFFSNCSTSQTYLTCQTDPQEIQIYGSPDACRFEFQYTKSLNKVINEMYKFKNKTTGERSDTETVIVNMVYQFVGGTIEIQRLSAISNDDSFVESAYLTFNNSFFKWSLAVGFGLTTFVVLVLRVTITILAFKSGQLAAKSLNRPDN